ncbi:MAG: DNA-binding protein [Clostridiales bacterium]|nr:DNA-binding protein [Clostridiales bacterium]
MKEIVRTNILMDFYGSLLTTHQLALLEQYVSNDYSFSEIAVIKNISRQGVYDNIKRAVNILEEYEKKLNLYKKYLDNQSKTIEIIQLIEQQKYEKIINVVNEIVER